MSKNIEYFDTETWSWKVCGYLKKNPETIIVVAVEGKVCVFNGYGMQSASNQFGKMGGCI